FGTEWGGVAIVSVADWKNFPMVDDGDGKYTASTERLGWDRIAISSAPVSVDFTDRTGNSTNTVAADALNIADVLWRTLTGHSGDVSSVTFSPDGATLASGSYDNTIKLWRVSDGSLIRTLRGHSSFVLSVAFSPDGTTLASGSQDKTIKLWP
ncbi:MAG: hypothetical protein V2A56_12575, partial [bacterium]